jgi:hypothetical protein
MGFINYPYQVWKTMNITVVGHVCIDHNISEHSSYQAAGSPAMFISRAYTQFPNVSVSIIAPYGRDFLQYSHRVSLIPTSPPREKTLIYENTTQGKTRTQKALQREFAHPLPITQPVQNIMTQSDILFFAPLIPDYSVEYVTNVTKYAGKALKVILPQGYFRNFLPDNTVTEREFTEATKILSLFDFAIVSDQDHKDMESRATSWSGYTRLIVTLGEKGAVYLKDNDQLLIPTNPVKPEDVVDSVGSGDIFSASFAYWYLLHHDVRKSLIFANDIARQGLFFSADDLKFTLPKN